MRYSHNEGLEYLKAYPKLKKWINICICCGSIGYNPDMPEKLTRNLGQGEFATVSAQTIRKYFNPLKVNELGICEVCEKFTHTL